MDWAVPSPHGFLAIKLRIDIPPASQQQAIQADQRPRILRRNQHRFQTSQPQRSRVRPAFFKSSCVTATFLGTLLFWCGPGENRKRAPRICYGNCRRPYDLPAMKISSVRSFLLSYPFKEPLKLAFYGGERTILKRDAMIIRIDTDNGLSVMRRARAASAPRPSSKTPSRRFCSARSWPIPTPCASNSSTAPARIRTWPKSIARSKSLFTIWWRKLSARRFPKPSAAACAIAFAFTEARVCICRQNATPRKPPPSPTSVFAPTKCAPAAVPMKIWKRLPHA